MIAGWVRNRQRLRPNCETSVCSRAVTPVIGIVLLVSIVIVIAVATGVFFLAFSDVNDPAPQAAFDVDVNEQEGQATITVDGGETIDADALSVAGGEIAHAPETLYAGSTLQIDLAEDADQLQLLYEQDDSSTILTETDRNPFINVTVRFNPGIPGVLVTAEDDGTTVADARTDNDGIARLVVDDPDQTYDVSVRPDDEDIEEITVNKTAPDDVEVTTSDLEEKVEDETDITPADLSQKSTAVDVQFGEEIKIKSESGLNDDAFTTFERGIVLENTGGIPTEQNVTVEAEADSGTSSADVRPQFSEGTADRKFTVGPDETKEIGVSFNTGGMEEDDDKEDLHLDLSSFDSVDLTVSADDDDEGDRIKISIG